MILQTIQNRPYTAPAYFRLNALEQTVYHKISDIPADYEGLVKFGTTDNPVWAYVTIDGFYLLLEGEWHRVATQLVASRVIVQNS